MRHHHISTNGITVHAAEHGDGEAVIFCHGFPDTWHGWTPQMRAVAAAGFRAIALDMRGYGESSAPDEAAVYTPFHTVGDLVGVLDALAIDTATVVGHDFGANVAWNAAMMRPDRFTAVLGMSVPFQPLGGQSFLNALRQAGREDFYMFRQMLPEAEEEWRNAAVTIPAMRYWTSAAAPEELRWDPFDPAKSLTRPAPADRPAWLDDGNLQATIAEFQRNGFHGPLNYYRAIQPFFDMAGAFAGATVRQPSLFLTGALDPLNGLRPVDELSLRPMLPGLRGVLKIDGVGHWPQLEATEALNAALVGFLTDLPAASR